jgi:F0F1-type ATP synthase membrane subunit b/b'
MEILLNVFESLGINHTVFYQFFVFVAVFVILKQLLFKELLRVIKDREEKTVVSEKNAEEVALEAKILKGKYDQLVSDIYKKYQDKFNEDKEDIIREHQARFEQEQETFLKLEEQKIAEINSELASLKADSFKERDSLKNELINKLT